MTLLHNSRASFCKICDRDRPLNKQGWCLKCWDEFTRVVIALHRRENANPNKAMP